ncbi:hypothetical protein DPEC_G00126020 [Dallia pectoralis]|uniref:Uncharacterized protein n=1 Tax=Dallia pectoralis TaxID=75939 RepID=A0ACC2GRE2_DALPE|nr:hypothetical protein DPEC_G00126020 [Dallia pectoralis]
MVRNNIDTGITSLPGKKSFSDQDYHRSHVDGRSYADVTREGRGREPTQVFYQRRTRGRGYSNWDREQVRSRQRRDRYEPRKEETRRRFYDGANRYDRAAKQNGGNDRYRHGGQQPNNVVNRNRNSSHFGRRLKRETLREVRAQLVQRLAGAPSSRPADGGDDAIQPATQSDPERTTAQHSQQTLDVPVRTPASVSIPAMAQSRLIVTAEIHPPPRGQRSPEILMTPTPSAVPGQVTAGTNMEQGGDWSPDIQHSSPPGFPSPGRSSPTLQTPREQRPARGPRQPPGGTTAVPEYPVSAPSRRDEPMRRPPTSDEDTDGEQQSGPFVPELSTSTPPRRDEPLMELTSDEEDQDGEQQPEPLVLPVTKDGRETVQSLLDFAVPKVRSLRATSCLTSLEESSSLPPGSLYYSSSSPLTMAAYYFKRLLHSTTTGTTCSEWAIT